MPQLKVSFTNSVQSRTTDGWYAGVLEPMNDRRTVIVTATERSVCMTRVIPVDIQCMVDVVFQWCFNGYGWAETGASFCFQWVG